MNKQETQEQINYLTEKLIILNGKINSMFPFDPPKLSEATEEIEKQIKELRTQLTSN